MVMHVEDLLSKISESSICYRWILTIILGITFLKEGLDIFVLNLTTAATDFHCAEASVDNNTVTWTVVAGNVTDVSFSNFTCQRPVFLTGVDGELELVGTEMCTTWNFMSAPKSMTAAFEIVCDRRYLADRLQTLQQLGALASTLLVPLADVIGRKPFLIFSFGISVAANIAAIFATNLTFQMILRCFIGLVSSSQAVAAVMITELMGTEFRSMQANAMALLFAVGYCLSPLLSWLLPGWQVEQAVTVLFGVLGLLGMVFLVPESPQWLVSRKRLDLARGSLTQMCERAGCPDAISELQFTELQSNSAESAEASSTSCCIPMSRKDCSITFTVTLITVVFSAFGIFLVFTVLSLKRDFIVSDARLTVLVSALLEVPAWLLSWQLSVRVGRLRSCVVCFIVGGVGVLALPVLSDWLGIVGSAIVASCVKVIVSVAMSVLWLFASELMATQIRSCAMSVFDLSSSIASFLGPEFNTVVSSAWYLLPEVLCCCLLLLGAVLMGLLLPDTRDVSLPETTSDMRLQLGCCRQQNNHLQGSDYQLETETDGQMSEKKSDTDEGIVG